MLNFSQLLKEQKDNKPLNGGERKIINILLKKFFLEDEDYDGNELIFEGIFNYLLTTMAFTPYQSLQIYNLLYLNSEKLKRGESNWMDNPIRELKKGLYKDEIMALANFLILPPHLIEIYQYKYYGMDQLDDLVSGSVYAVGDEDKVDSAIVNMAETATYGLQNNSSIADFVASELHSLWGDHLLIKHMYVSKDWKHRVASDDARRIVEDDYYDDEEILNFAETIDPSIGVEWERLHGLIEDLREQGFPESENEEQQEIYEDKILGYEKEITKLAESSKDILYDYEYDVVMKRLTDDLLDYLWEMDYINRRGENGKWSFNSDTSWSERKNFRFPEGVNINLETLEKELILYYRKYKIEELGRYDHKEHIEEYDGVWYYIYKVE